MNVAWWGKGIGGPRRCLKRRARTLAIAAYGYCSLGAAEPGTVRVTARPESYPRNMVTDCKSRVIAELSGIGVSVQETPNAAPRSDEYAEVQIAPHVITLTLHGPPESVVQLPYRSTNVRTVAARVAELVRASMLRDEARTAAQAEEPMPAEPKASEPPEEVREAPLDAPTAAEPSRPVAPVGEAQVRRASVSLGGTALVHPSASFALAPTVALWWHVAPHFALRASGVGPAFGPELTPEGARVTLRQELARVDFAHQGFGLPWLVLSLGVGGYHAHARGTAAAPLEGRADDVSAALVAAGVGASFDIAPKWAFVADVQAMALLPRPVVATPTANLPLGRPLLAGAVAFRVDVL